MLHQRMLCRAFRPPKLRKNRKSTQPPTGAKRRDRQFRGWATNLWLAHKPCPLDGCPRFAPAYLGRKRRGRSPPPKLLYPDQGSVTPGVKACDKSHFQPRYAGANLGHPSRGQGLAASRESGGERTANRQTELTSFLFSLPIGESTAPNDKGEGGDFYWEPSDRMDGKKQQVLGKPGQAG